MSAATEGANLGASGVPTRTTERDLDQARTVLEQWLATTLPGVEELRIDDLSKPATSGVANETLLCEAHWSGADGERRQRFVVRVHSPEFLYKDVDLAVHAGMYEALAGAGGVPVPHVVGYESDPALLGQSFFVMEHVDGRVPPDQPPFHTGGWVAELPTETRHVMWRNAVEVLAALHQVDPARVALLDRPALGPTGLEQDLRYWLDYREWAGRGRAHAVIDTCARWLVDNLPDERPTALAWGDARVGNMIFDDAGEVVAVLDWDMVSLAGPESDLAWWAIMDVLQTTSAGVPRLEGFGSPAETIARWETLAGRPVRDLDYHLVYASFRMAVILVRLADLLGEAGLMPPALVAEMTTNNSGIQYVATLLDLPHDGTIATPWPGLDA